MRWDNLRKEEDDSGRLPGMSGAPVIRTFDAPEAVGINFHEVHAKSAINDVPPMAQVDFRHTVNPYRGCTHGCVYCVSGDTQVLMASGNTRRIADVRPGDAIYGTRVDGSYRRYVKTEVLDHWRTEKPAYKITLEDGTELVASGDHRFLSNRGWKFVTGTQGGPGQRPHLTTSNRLLGIGTSSAPVSHGRSYRAGYLCGIMRGDGTIGTYEYGDGRRRRVHWARLALTDEEALDRTEGFLRAEGVHARRWVHAAATTRAREVKAVGVTSGAAVERCRELIAWPERPDFDWTRGFLAGIFDAEGSCDAGGVLRITNTDERLIARIEDGIYQLGVPWRLEGPRLTPGKPIWAVRLRGGLRGRMKFFQETDPAITRKRAFDGMAVKAKHQSGVVAVEPLGETVEMFDISTGTEDFIANGVISHNCFARPTHEYLDFNARDDFRTQIVVKVNVPEVLRAELRRPSWKGEHIALGTNTDPYQWVESKYELTRAIWEQLLEARNSCSILTRSPLLLRDLDLFTQLNDVTEFAANLSIPTVDESAWRLTEPASPNPMKRIEALTELADAGIKTGVLVAPLLPGINDSPEQVERVLELCGEAGATSIGGIGLHLRGPLKAIFMDWLRQYRPDLVDRYERLYPARSGYLPKEERARLQKMIRRGRMRTPGAPGLRARARRAEPGENEASGGDAPSEDSLPRAARTTVQTLF